MIGAGLTVRSALGAGAGLVIGVIVHEAIHLIAYRLLGHGGRLDIGIEHFGIVVTPTDTPSRAHVAIASLAPVVGVLPVVDDWLGALSVPIDAGAVLVLAAYTIAVLPSPGDIYTMLMYQPELHAGGVADG